MAGSISLSVSQQFDELGRPLSGGKLFFYQASTVATRQNAFQDYGLTIPHPNPITLNEAGRVPQFYLADGFIKIVLTNSDGVAQVAADNILVVGPSSGGGGGGGVDPTSVIQTGWLQPIYGTGAVTGFVRANGRTIGSASSSATERANSDTQALFIFLWTQDANLAVSGGRGGSAAADFAANKTIALPEARGRALATLADMGNTDVGSYSGLTFSRGSASTIGSLVGISRVVLLNANLPAYTPSGIITNGQVLIGGSSSLTYAIQNGLQYPSSPGAQVGAVNTTQAITQGASSFAGTAQGGTSTPVDSISPYFLITLYLKL